jgi:hypothetical protein
MRTAAALLIAAVSLAACAACGEPEAQSKAPPPGYSGSVPSPEAQGRIQEAVGRPVPVGFEGVTEEGWVLVDFGVVPSDAAPGGKGPVVRIRKGEKFREIFVPDDAAVDRLVAAIAKGSAAR